MLLQWSDLRLTGAQRAMEPLLGLLAAIGRLAGVDERLAERYVRI